MALKVRTRVVYCCKNTFWKNDFISFYGFKTFTELHLLGVSKILPRFKFKFIQQQLQFTKQLLMR